MQVRVQRNLVNKKQTRGTCFLLVESIVYLRGFYLAWSGNVYLISSNIQHGFEDKRLKKTKTRNAEFLYGYGVIITP